MIYSKNVIKELPGQWAISKLSALIIVIIIMMMMMIHIFMVSHVNRKLYCTHWLITEHYG